MPGSADNATLRRVFGYVEMPATIEQLEDSASPAFMGMVSRVIYTRLGNGVIKDGDAFWISEEVLAEGIAYWEEDLKKTQRYLDYLKAQRDKLELRNVK
ncbi:MAG TPA: hypothetical protein VF817_03755 [Patescibacteria group bacterium]